MKKILILLILISPLANADDIFSKAWDWAKDNPEPPSTLGLTKFSLNAASYVALCAIISAREKTVLVAPEPSPSTSILESGIHQVLLI
jgi:hypothetical protein